MSTQPPTILPGLHLVGIEQVRQKWLWFVALGVLEVVLGSVALGHSVTTTVVSMVFIGWLMIIGGALQTAHAVSCKEWSGCFIDLLAGILYTVAGFLIISRPAAAAVTLTLLIAILLMFGGVFRIVLALSVRYHNWVWLLFHGVVNLMLGLSIWQDWPVSGLWVIGMFIGIDMLLNGWSLIMLGFGVKNIPGTPKAS